MDKKNLQKKALKILKNMDKKPSEILHDNNVEEILQELDIHSAELQAQNEELNRLNEELQYSRVEYEALFNNAPIPILLINEKLQIKKINNKARSYFDSDRMRFSKYSLMSLAEQQSIGSIIEWSKEKNMLHSNLLVALYCQKNKIRTFEISATRHPYKNDWFILTLIDKDDEKRLMFANDEIQSQNEALQEEILAQQIEKNKNYQQVLYSLLDMVEKRDTYTAGHTQRVARYSVLIAEEMGLDQRDIDTLYEAAIMHDIGKVSTPDAILLKPGKLSSDEYAIIKEHLNCGFEILNSIENFKEHAQIMRSHHERYDGRGYPQGLKGDEIPLLSHILIVADAFDAMTSRRIYKSQKSLKEALDELKEFSGSQFSPKVVEHAISALSKAGIIPVDHNYLSDNLEEARVAFYYKDGLTGLYNYHYFEHILFFANEFQKKEYRCCYFIDIQNFHHFNEKYGWVEGDNKLLDMAQNLKKYFKDSTLFRVYGDDFLVLNEEHQDISQEELESILGLKNSMLDVEIHHLELFKLDTKNFHEFSKYIDDFIIKKQDED